MTGGKRKLDHIKMCINKDVESSGKNWFGDVSFIPRALPEINPEDVDTSIEFFGRRLASPLIIEGMTGGIKEATRINAILAEAAEKLNISMGVGSQRIAIENPKLTRSFRVVREKAPNAFLIANVGCPQLSRDFGLKEIEKSIDMIDANAIAVHMNPLQEIIQLGGEAYYRNVIKKLTDLVPRIRVPVIVKETGAGVAKEDAVELGKTGIHGIDVGGCGGTSWAAVEYHRAKARGDRKREALGKSFWEWGIPTTVSVVEVRRSFGGTVIASGGIRDGIDVAKALALGADCVGMALPLLRMATKDPSRLAGFLGEVIQELRICMFLVGARSIQELKRAPIIVAGKTGEWLRLRGIDIEDYARR